MNGPDLNDPVVVARVKAVLESMNGLDNQQMQAFWEIIGVYVTGFLRGLQGEQFVMGYLQKAMEDKTKIRRAVGH